MQTTSTLNPTLVSILMSDHMTATVDTVSGSRYTVVARPAVGVVLIHDTDGWARKAHRLEVLDGRMYLVGQDDNQIIWRTTDIVHISILSN